VYVPARTRESRNDPLLFMVAVRIAPSTHTVAYGTPSCVLVSVTRPTMVPIVPSGADWCGRREEIEASPYGAISTSHVGIHKDLREGRPDADIAGIERNGWVWGKDRLLEHKSERGLIVDRL
jgi:hypothetical protein